MGTAKKRLQLHIQIFRYRVSISDKKGTALTSVPLAVEPWLMRRRYGAELGDTVNVNRIPCGGVAIGNITDIGIHVRRLVTLDDLSRGLVKVGLPADSVAGSATEI